MNLFVHKDNNTAAMDDLELSQKFFLSESALYKDFMEHRFIERFNALKNNHSGEQADRHKEAQELLKTLQNSHTDLHKSFEEELEYFIDLSGCAVRDERWLRCFSPEDKIIDLALYCSWFGKDDGIVSVFPWFDIHHNFNGMKAQSYLAGAKILVVSDKLVPEVKHLSARLLLEDWCYWKTVHTDPPSQTFLELLHVEMAFVKLGLTSLEHPENMVVPANFIADFARKLLKGIQSGRRQIALSPAWVALQEKFSRPPEEPPTKRRRAADKRDDENIDLADAEGQSEGQLEVQPDVGDEVLTHSLQKKESHDAQRAVVQKLLAKSCRVLFITGPCKGQSFNFAYKNVSLVKSEAVPAVSPAGSPAAPESVQEALPPMKTAAEEAALAEELHQRQMQLP